MSALSDVIADNRDLHAIVSREPRREGASATERASALLERSTHEPTRGACRRLIEALEAMPGLDSSPEALVLEIRSCEAAIAMPTTSLEARETLLVRKQLLRRWLRAAAVPSQPAIPRIVHLVKTDSGNADLPLLQFLCYRSVLAHCKGYRVMLHAPEVPRGRRWSALLPHLELRISTPPQFLASHRIFAAAHQSDVWRLQQLFAHGGFYFDWDLFLLREPEALRDNVCVMALERKEEGFDEVLGVSAIGAEPGSVFLESWLGAMPAAFNPRRYVAHSTVLARRLAMQRPSLVRVLDHRAFYYPGWGEAAMRWLFDPAERMPDSDLEQHLEESFGIHLFCSHANFVQRAAAFAETDIARAECNLAALMRPYL